MLIALRDGRHEHRGAAARPVVQLLAQVAALRGHVHRRLWPDVVSLVQPGTFNSPHVLAPRKLTDAYLLALAGRHQGRFVMLDLGIPLQAAYGARAEGVPRLACAGRRCSASDLSST